MQIIVVDAMMGMGKTSASINYMEKYHDSKKFLFITPYLDEGERIKQACALCNFQSPPLFGNKQTGLKYLLRTGANIVSTHAMFSMLDEESLELIQDSGYTLVMDEVLEAVSEYDASDCDIDILMKAGVISTDSIGVMAWNDKSEYTGAFNKLKKDMDSKTLVSVRAPPNGEEAREGSTILTVMPTISFSCFEQIIVLTYLFEGSLLKSYFDLFGFSYQYIGVQRNKTGEYKFCEEKNQSVYPGISSLIHFWEPAIKQKCAVGNRKGSLSVSWFKNHSAKSEQIVALKKHMRNFYSNATKARGNDALWTTFKFAEKKISGPGYARSFAPHNIRATNKYKNRWAVAYALNKYLSPGVVDFFNQNNIDVDVDQYALSTMIQFIWRSSIRDGKPISVYIPSLRMRQLFESWLKEVDCQ